MLRVYFLQQWYGLADEALEDALYDSQALQGFARINLAAGGGPGPDPIHEMGFSPHSKAARTGARLGLASVQIGVKPFVTNTFSAGRQQTNQTKTESMKTVNKIIPMGAVAVVAIALPTWLPTSASELQDCHPNLPKT